MKEPDGTVIECSPVGTVIGMAHRLENGQIGQSPCTNPFYRKEHGMTGMNDHRSGADAAASLARGVRSRFGYLMLAGMLTVALIFGISFYFALLSNQSAVARQFPELEDVAAKLKSVLLVNTFAITAIIILSFFLLATIATSRIFQPLSLLHRDLLSVAGGKLPRRGEKREGGAFSELETAWSAALACIHEKEIKEIKELADCAASLSRSGSSKDVAAKLHELSERKKSFAGAAELHPESIEKETKKDPLFIQPI
jgi:methyl-accepting chemotaxis protein